MRQTESRDSFIGVLGEIEEHIDRRIDTVSELQKNKSYLRSIYFMCGAVGAVEQVFYGFFPEYRVADSSLLTILPGIVSVGALYRAYQKEKQLRDIEVTRENMDEFKLIIEDQRNKITEQELVDLVPALTIDDDYLKIVGYIGNIDE